MKYLIAAIVMVLVIVVAPKAISSQAPAPVIAQSPMGPPAKTDTVVFPAGASGASGSNFDVYTAMASGPSGTVLRTITCYYTDSTKTTFTYCTRSDQ